jgi:hypothetical protein
LGSLKSGDEGVVDEGRKVDGEGWSAMIAEESQLEVKLELRWKIQ